MLDGRTQHCSGMQKLQKGVVGRPTIKITKWYNTMRRLTGLPTNVEACSLALAHATTLVQYKAEDLKKSNELAKLLDAVHDLSEPQMRSLIAGVPSIFTSAAGYLLVVFCFCENR